VFVEVGVRWDTQPVENSESDWLDYAFVWVTAAAGRRSGSHVARQAITTPRDNCRAGVEGWSHCPVTCGRRIEG